MECHERPAWAPGNGGLPPARKSIRARRLSFSQEFVQTFLTKIYSYDTLLAYKTAPRFRPGRFCFWTTPAAHGFVKGLIQKRLTQGPQSPESWGPRENTGL